MHSRFVVCPLHVGRDQEIDALRDAATTLSRGRGRTTLVTGAAGMGKTRLVGEAASLATERDVEVLQGSCLEDSTGAYTPLVTALRRRLRRPDREEALGWFEGAARLALALLPEVAVEVGATPAVTSISPDDLDTAVWHLLAHAAAARPLLVVFEDLQWAGLDMLRLLSSLVRETGDLPVWLIGTYRSEELAGQHPLTTALAALARERRYDEIVLEPLGRDALRSMLSAIFDRTPVGDGFLDQVYARSGGNPFFVEELCRMLIERGDVFLQEGGWRRRELAAIEMPSTIRAVLLSRARHVPPRSLAALRLAAVAGERVEPEVLRRAAGLDPTSSAAVIADGIDHHLLVERRDDGVPAYAFRDNLTRELLAADLVGPQRQLAHARIAAALVEVHGAELDGALAAAVADHAEAAADPGLAAEYARLAARHSERVRAPDAMLARYRQALRHVPVRAPARLSLLIEAAEATVGADHRDAAVGFAEEARELALAGCDDVAVARSVRVLAQARWWSGDVEGSVDLGRTIVRHVEGRGDRWEVWALSYLARRCALSDRDSEARSLVLRALPMAEAIGELVEASRLHDTLAVLGADEASVAAEWQAAVAAARAAGDPLQEAVVLYNSGQVALWYGDYATAARCLDDALALSRRLVSPFEAQSGIVLAVLQALRGELSPALETVARYRRGGSAITTADALTAIGEVQLRTGDPAARATAAEHLRVARAVGENQLIVPALAAMARAELVGGLPLARPLFEEAMERARSAASARLLHWSFTPDVARALAGAGECDGLAAWAAAVAACTAGPAAHRHNQAALHLCEGLSAGMRGDLTAARQNLGSAATLYAAMPSPGRRCEALLGLAGVELAAGDVAAGAGWARQAHALARHTGLAPLVAEAAGLLRRAGARPSSGRRRRAEEGGLSERELEVARLVARGLSNAEVGRRLFVSELTARNHVSNILAKLELRTRADVARWVAERGLLDAPSGSFRPS